MRSKLVCALLATAALCSVSRPAPAEVVLWNKVGSTSEIEDSVHGLDGWQTGGFFTEGRFGDAVAAEYFEEWVAHFPKEVIPIERGCLELWGRVWDAPPTLGHGGSGCFPVFARVQDTQQSTWHVHLK